jgi:predicted nucleic acid-binding protein
VNVLVDTSVWSLVLRRRNPDHGPVERELSELIREGRVVMIGAVRQELLSGVRTEAQLRKLRDKLRAFGDLQLDAIDYETAASCANRCRARGAQGGAIDFLLCGVSVRRSLALFSTDKDFDRFATILALKRHGLRPELVGN